MNRCMPERDVVSARADTSIEHVINNTFQRGRDHSTRFFALKPRVITEFIVTTIEIDFRCMFVLLHKLPHQAAE